MHIICLAYHVLETALFWDVSASFLIFSLNYQQGVTWCCIYKSTNEKRLQDQVYRQIKSKLIDMDTFRSDKSSPFENVDFSLYCFLSSFSKSK